MLNVVCDNRKKPLVIYKHAEIGKMNGYNTLDNKAMEISELGIITTNYNKEK